MPDSLPWDDVTAAFRGELLSWEAYAVQVRLWTEALRVRIETGQGPSGEHRRVIGEIAPGAMLEQAEWVAESAEHTARSLRERLASGDIQNAYLLVLSPTPGARGFDYRAPGFWHGPVESGDLPPMWDVADRARRDVLSAALFPSSAPPWFLQTLQAWARPIARVLWTESYALQTLTEMYASFLDETGNPWGASGEDNRRA